MKKAEICLENSINSILLKQEQTNQALIDLQISIENDIIDIKESLKESLKESSEPIIIEKIDPSASINIKHHQENNDKIHKVHEDLSKYKDDFLIFKESFKQELKKLKKNLLKKQKNSLFPLENSIKALQDHSQDLSGIKEKLCWLPVDLKELKGMNPTDARIFIIEARLRSEENIRNEQYNKLVTMLDTIKFEIKTSSENFIFSQILPNLRSHGFETLTPDLTSQNVTRRLNSSIQSMMPNDKITLRTPIQNRTSVSVDLSRRRTSVRKKQDTY